MLNLLSRQRLVWRGEHLLLTCLIHGPHELCNHFRKTISSLSVVAGQYNLIEVEGTEQEIAVFKITSFDGFNSTVNKTHDIALIEVGF